MSHWLRLYRYSPVSCTPEPNIIRHKLDILRQTSCALNSTLIRLVHNSTMSIDNSRLTRLERLPTEIVHAVVGFLKPWDVKKLSYTSKRLRQACLPTIFRRVEFEFSLHGIGELKDLLKSDVRSHVRSFSYELTGLLKPGEFVHPLPGRAHAAH